MPALSSGYVKKARRELKAKRPIEQKPVPVVEPPKPLPPGLPEALQAMGALARHVKTIARTAFSVSVDYVDNEWILVCRGFRPAFDYYGGYSVRFVESHSFTPNKK